LPVYSAASLAKLLTSTGYVPTFDQAMAETNSTQSRHTERVALLAPSPR
jgi:hypothetical protein